MLRNPTYAFLSLFSFGFLRQGLMYPRLTSNSLHGWGWPWTPDLPASTSQMEFIGIHHHTRQDSISKNYKKGTNKLKKKTKKKPENPTNLQKMITSKFPRQLLEVGIPFYRKLYFSEQSNYFISIKKVEKMWKLSTITKGEANILFVNLHGPHWAISSHEKDWPQQPSQMWKGQSLKYRILQTADKAWQLAHMLQAGKEMATK